MSGDAIVFAVRAVGLMGLGAIVYAIAMDFSAFESPVEVVAVLCGLGLAFWLGYKFGRLP